MERILSNTDECVNCSHDSAQDPKLEVERLSKRKKPIFKSNDFYGYQTV
jgi:hypothetical protein